MQRRITYRLDRLSDFLTLLRVVTNNKGEAHIDPADAEKIAGWIEPLLREDLPGIIEASWKVLGEQGFSREGAGPLSNAIADAFEKRRVALQGLASISGEDLTRIAALERDKDSLATLVKEQRAALDEANNRIRDTTKSLNAANVDIFQKETRIGQLEATIKRLEGELPRFAVLRDTGELIP